MIQGSLYYCSHIKLKYKYYVTNRAGMTTGGFDKDLRPYIDNIIIYIYLYIAFVSID